MKFSLFLALLFALFCTSCKNNSTDSTSEAKTKIYPISNNYHPSNSSISTYSPSPSTSQTEEVLDEEDGKNYHTDANYKYEYRTRTSGNYEYNYDVNGSDESGTSISGNVDMRGKYGSGTITDENGDEHEVEVEWTGNGELQANDEDGNTYEMEAD